VVTTRGAKPYSRSSLRISLAVIRLSPARLDENIKDFALLIDSPLQIHASAGDLHDHLIQMPPITRPEPPLPQLLRQEPTEFQHPAPDRFIGQVEPALGKELLDITVTERKAEIEPNRMADDLGREAVAAVGERDHAPA
jgi:hypothetical protein